MNWHACLKNPRVTMRHKISYSYKTVMVANCRTPNGHWKDTYALLQQKNSCRRNQRARLQSHTDGLLLPKESAHPCGSPSQCNRTCSHKPTAPAHASERTTPPTQDLNTADTSSPSRSKMDPICAALHALEGITQSDIGYVGAKSQLWHSET